MILVTKRSQHCTDSSFTKKEYIPLSQESVENICGICEKGFPTTHGLKLHEAKIHPTTMNFNCNNCKERFQSRNNLDEHRNTMHSCVSSPDAKKIKVDYFKYENRKGKRTKETEVNENNFEYVDDKIEMVEIKKEDELNILSRLKDQKVLRKQKSREKEQEVRAKVQKLKQF